MTYPKQHIDIEIPHGSRDHVIVLMLGSKEIDTINNADIYDTYKDLYLSEKEREEKLLQGIQSANGLKARTSVKKGRWHGTNSYNQGKCNQKDFW